MRLYARQKLLTFRTAFSIMDEKGRPAYTVKGEILTLTKRLHIYDRRGKEVGMVKGKLFTVMPTYDIYVGGRMRGRIVKRLTLLRPSYVIKDSNWRVEGDFLAHDYRVYDGEGDKAASIRKRWISIGDCFELDVPEKENEIMALCVMLAIDCVLDDQNTATQTVANQQ